LIQIGEIVQLDPVKTENPMFRACMMTVCEATARGVLGYVQALGENGEPGGQAYYRAAHGTFHRTGGVAGWVVKY